MEREKFARMHFLEDVLRCSTKFIVDFVSDEETDEEMVVFRDVLELPQHVDIANRTNEYHLSPEQRGHKVVRRLRDKGVGVEEIDILR